MTISTAPEVNMAWEGVRWRDGRARIIQRGLGRSDAGEMDPPKPSLGFSEGKMCAVIINLVVFVDQEVENEQED